MKQRIIGVIKSTTVFFRSLGYILSSGKTFVLVLVPILLNMIITVVFFALIFNKISGLIDGLDHFEFFYNHEIILTILKVFGGIIAFIISGLILLATGMIVSAPFNSLISEQLLRENGVTKIHDYEGIKLVFYEVFRALKFEVQKVLLLVVVFFLSLLLNLIPLVGGVLFTTSNYFLNAFLTELDLQDVSNELLRRKFRDKVKMVFKNWDLNFPFMFFAGFVLSIPFINIIFLPFASVSATFLYIDGLHREK